MNNVVKLQTGMTPQKAELLIKELAKDSKNVRFGTHAIERMEEREISFADAMRVLCNGYIEGKPEKGKKPNEWKCKMVRHARGNRDIGVVTIIIREEFLFVKTVEWEDL